MKKEILMSVLLSSAATNSFAGGTLGPHGMSLCGNPLKQENVFYSTGATTLCGFEGTVSASDATSELSTKSARKELFAVAAQGAQRITMASSTAEMEQIFNQDENLRNAFHQLQSEGIQGTALDFANRVLEITERQ